MSSGGGSGGPPGIGAGAGSVAARKAQWQAMKQQGEKSGAAAPAAGAAAAAAASSTSSAASSTTAAERAAAATAAAATQLTEKERRAGEQRLREEIEEEIRRELRLKRGELYQQLEAEISERLMGDEGDRKGAAATTTSAAPSASTLSDEGVRQYLMKYETQFRSAEEQFEQRVMSVIQGFERTLTASREEWTRRHATELERVSKEWADQWKTALRQQQEGATGPGAAPPGGRVLASAIETVEQSTAQLAMQGRDLRADMESKFEEALRRLQEQEAQSRTMMEEGHRKEISALETSIDEERRLHNTTLQEMEAAHARQLQVLQQTIAEERQEAFRSQQVFEETLRLKYETMVKALQDKVKAEQEAQMQRALDALEKAARAESERARQEYETQATAEAAANAKFQSLVTDLRKTWEEEEAMRARQLEQRLRTHYETVMEHMEAQLQMALKLNDEADRQWMEDVEARNRQQIATMRAFEEKCRRLYDTRLTEYIERTDKQLADYEEKLLESGSNAVMERAKLESKIRRLKLACSRWRADYQREMQRRYHETIQALEARYMHEIGGLLEELSETREALVRTEKTVQQREEEVLAERRKLESTERHRSSQEKSKTAGRLKISQMKSTLIKLWQGLGTTPEEQVTVLMDILDGADYSPDLLQRFETIQTKLSARLPILQMQTRKQYLEYRLKMFQRFANAGDRGANLPPEMQGVNKETLLNELHSLTSELETAVRSYESNFNETFQMPGGDAPQGQQMPLSPAGAPSGAAGGGAGAN